VERLIAGETGARSLGSSSGPDGESSNAAALAALSIGSAAALLHPIDFDEHAGWLRVGRGPYTLLANFSQRDVHVPLEATAELVLTTHHATLEPGYVVLPALSGALLR